MTDLADLAEALTKDLPIAARKVIDKALECGWELNKPGMTVALRLNHPTDELAQPVYITWVVSRTAKGAISFRFDSCGTKGLTTLKPADLLEYLEDPTVIYPTDEDLDEVEQKLEDKNRKKWDDQAPATINIKNQLGAQVIGIEVDKRKKTFSQIMRQNTTGTQSTTPSAPPIRVTAPKLRVQPPRLQNEPEPPWNP